MCLQNDMLIDIVIMIGTNDFKIYICILYSLKACGKVVEKKFRLQHGIAK